MDNVKASGYYGRGSPARDIFQNLSCPPTPSINTNNNINVASGRAARVLRQIKQSSSIHSTTDLSENQLLIHCAITPWYKYTIEFQPPVINRTARFTMINQLSKHLGGFYKLYDGEYIYVPHQFSREIFLFNTNEIRLQFIETINIEQIPIGLINILFRSAIDHGRESITNRQKIRYWNGKIVNIERKFDGLVLTIDFQHKSTTTTCYDELERFYMSTSVDNYQELARKDLINKLVLTRYDNRTQRIDNIDFQLTPATFTCNEDSKMTLMDYYLNKFDITIKDPDQPLIVYCPRRPGENPINTEANYLVPELCYLTGLTDRAHRDARARKINHLLPFDSAGRQAELMYFDDMFRRNPGTIKYLGLWGIDIVYNFIPSIDIPSRMHKNSNDSTPPEEEDDEDNDQKDIQEIEHTYGRFTNPIELNNWLLVYPKIDEDRALIYVNMLRQVGQQQGMIINEPIHVQMEDDETETYANTLRMNLNEQIQLVSVVVKSRRIDRYNTIKRICCIEIPTPTEIVLRSTISDDDILPGVALNIARDINFKLGGQIRPININIPNTMIISLGTWTSTNVNYKSSEHLDYVLAVVGSINSTMTEYFSHAKSYTNENDLRADIGYFVRLAIDAYYEENEIYPTMIILGRNVFSPFDDLKLIQENEIQSIINMITDENRMENYKPRLIVFAVMKQIIYDFYNYVQPKKIANVDCLIAKESPSYCFYLSSHRDRSSTFQARQFLVLFDNTDLSAQKVQRIILYLTTHIPQRSQFFLPSICRFAQRLSTLVGETLGAPPNCERYKNLFYL